MSPKLSIFVQVTTVITIISIIAIIHPMTVNAGSGFNYYKTEDGFSESTNLEEEAIALMKKALSQANQDSGPLPRHTELVNVTVDGDEITIDLRMPVGFLENDLDVFISDGISQQVINILLPLGVRIYHVRAENETGDFLPISDYLPLVQTRPPKISENLDPLPARLGPHPDKMGAPPLPGQGQPEGALTGKVVWLSAGHGWEWRNGKWKTQRPNTFGIIEDFSNAEALNYYLARYLWNAGADVWMVRERGMNNNEIIIDNDDGYPGYIETGEFNNSDFNGYSGGNYRYAVTTSVTNATATWRPVIPEAGWYPVWVWYRNSINRTVDARYEIHHSGGTTMVSISQEVHGMTWRYIGEYYFEAGTNGYVTLINESSDPDQAIIADAIRFGGGMGNLDPGGGISGKPRWEEASLYYAEFQGYPVESSINDVVVRPLYAEWEHASGYPDEDAVYISWHSNCCNYSGTMSFIHDTDPTPGSSSLRSWVHGELIQDLRGAWDARWLDQGKLSADFGELRELTSMPGVLLEIAFHDTENPGDADDLKEPGFRQIAARAVYQGIAKYFSTKDGSPLHLLPETPTSLSVKNTSSGRVTISWDAPASGGVYGDPATHYKIYHSTNGRGFDNGTVTTSNYLDWDGLQPGSLHFFRVTALNNGGESLPSQVLAVRTPEFGDSNSFLLVDGFDRLDKDAMISQAEGGELGVSKRMFLERMNRYDYAIEHAKSLHACSLSFDSTVNDAVEGLQIALSEYSAVDWFVGEDSIVDEALSGAERALLAAYLDEGGNLLLSGSDIGWDLASPEHGADVEFYNQYLKAIFTGNDAATHAFLGTENDIYKGLSGNFDDSTQGYYDVDSPDTLNSTGGSRVVLIYNGGTSEGAALAYSGNYRLVYFGFPLETVVDEGVRNQLICSAAKYLMSSTSEVQFLPFISSSGQ